MTVGRVKAYAEARHWLYGIAPFDEVEPVLASLRTVDPVVKKAVKDSITE